MRIYHHRINSVADLDAVPANRGIEFDLRSSGNDVIVTHDPFTAGVTIEEYFPHIGRRPCIFNIKCEGIEDRVRALAKTFDIEDYFFLDCSVPAQVRLARLGESRFAVRYSEFEPHSGVLKWAGKAQWVWVDCFDQFPTEEPAWSELVKHFKICLVSPELQGHDEARKLILRTSVAKKTWNAVCTKTPDSWTSTT